MNKDVCDYEIGESMGLYNHPTFCESRVIGVNGHSGLARLLLQEKCSAAKKRSLIAR